MAENQQLNLFDEMDEPAPWEQDDATDALLAEVVFPTGVEGPFDYLVPEKLIDLIEPGRRVRVPLGRGNRQVTGYCVALASKSVNLKKYKPVDQVLDTQTLLSSSMLRLTRWISETYLCPWGQVLDTVVPAGVRYQAGTRRTVVLTAAPGLPRQLDKLELTDKQAAVMKVLLASHKPLAPGQLAARAGCTQAPITALRKKGLICSDEGRVDNFTAKHEIIKRTEALNLNPDQRIALKTILANLNAGKHQTMLLHGVTGSGKTEVYIQAIEEVVRFGRQAIVLVPEISLTPQTLARFRCRFDRVAVLHSHMTDADRHWHWQQIADGAVQVVIGARSAIFAPTPHLGLIVLDEEHESTFKQESAPRYHARDVAIARAADEGVPLVLGSATPSLESWYRAQQGEFQLISMPSRVEDRPLPQVGIIDLRDRTHTRGSKGSISRKLHTAISEALQDQGQVILLLNRRGYSTHIQCPGCGHVVTCPDCEISLTHHRSEAIALCHYCDFAIPAPEACPACGFSGIQYSGLGTQRLEAEVNARFKNVACLRMDTDTMRARGSHEKALDAFREGKYRILLGTQMIAKGLDFPNVTLVGVINADTALHLPDFRASERTFHLVTQVAGRTGRGARGGRVVVQTFSPDHPAIQAAANHDYHRFVKGELPLREVLKYPPVGAMIRLVIRGPSEKITHEFSKNLAEQLRKSVPEVHARLCTEKGTNASAEPPVVRIQGPAPAPFAKLRGRYRFQIQFQGLDRDLLREVVRKVKGEITPPDEVQWIADVDPLDML